MDGRTISQQHNENQPSLDMQLDQAYSRAGVYHLEKLILL